jgi:hypothetical protein
MAENAENYSDIEEDIPEDIPGTKVETKLKGDTQLLKEIQLSKQLLGNLKPTFKYVESNYALYFDKLIDDIYVSLKILQDYGI